MSFHIKPKKRPDAEHPSDNSNGRAAAWWDLLSQLGLAEVVLRLGTHALLIALILVLAWGLRGFYTGAGGVALFGGSPLDAPAPTGTVVQAQAALPDFAGGGPSLSGGTSANGSPRLALPAFLDPRAGVSRLANFHTDAPSRGRDGVTIHVVKPGDTLFGIAKQYGLQPETILWANQFTLGDNPHSLRPDQELNILPVDGAYHRWSAGDGLNGVARFFNVSPEAIVNFPANGLNPDTIGDLSNPNIEAGKWLVIPGGRREFVSWSAPVIPLDNPGVAKVLGPGACEAVAPGAVGAGIFIWPTANHFLSGYDYEPNANHSGIDIDGDEGAAVFAADNGVVVYAGWNNWGYGNVVVINHGNGWQTLYAHLSAYYVNCGQSVYQGNSMAAVGNTGNSSGPHLHFEMMYNGTKVNPHDYLK